jgi:hypothetical protein
VPAGSGSFRLTGEITAYGPVGGHQRRINARPSVTTFLNIRAGPEIYGNTQVAGRRLVTER